MNGECSKGNSAKALGWPGRGMSEEQQVQVQDREVRIGM